MAVIEAPSFDVICQLNQFVIITIFFLFILFVYLFHCLILDWINFESFTPNYRQNAIYNAMRCDWHEKKNSRIYLLSSELNKRTRNK